MEQYEYLTKTFKLGGFSSLESYLNKLGKDGWELINCQQIQRPNDFYWRYHCIFKRKIETLK